MTAAMTAATVLPPPPPGQPFTVEQKEFLAGLMAGIAQRQLHPYVGLTHPGQTLTDDPARGGPNLASPTAEEGAFGTPLSELTRQELWKHAENPLDSWDRLVAHAEANRFPNEEDSYRFRTFGLFYVGPAQESFMLRCRIPAGQLTAAQLTGLADLADTFGDGRAALTTRSNVQIRGIQPRHLVEVLLRLQSLGLTSRGSGVDNIRNITASPTAGLDPQELIDTSPFAHALHHYILNHRDLYGLPRKFNVAFEGGGLIDTVADSNDIGFMAVTLPPGTVTEEGLPVPPGVHFRVELAGISGHRQLAVDSGVLIRPSEAVAVAAAMIRVFAENGDRTDRKKARLKYLIDRWGIPRFLEETQKKLAFPLVRLPQERCIRRPPSLPHGHLGVCRQRQPGRNWLGIAIPVGLLRSRQMRRLAELATHYGSGQIRLTPWQNLILPDLPDAFVATVQRAVVRAGLHHEASHVTGGLVACTGNQGCKWAASDTKGHALQLAEHLGRRLQLDRPVNIHLTGCPNSCAQHYLGDIGLQGVKVSEGTGSVEGYHVVLGGGIGASSGIGRQVFTGIPASETPELLERILQRWLNHRRPGESFVDFTRRHELGQLQELFSA